MHRHACHKHRLACRLAALRERNAQQTRGAGGIVKKKLVKIAHAVKQQRLRKICFDLQVLRHHGGVGGKRVFFKRSVHACNLTDGLADSGMGAWENCGGVLGILGQNAKIAKVAELFSLGYVKNSHLCP